MEVFWSAMKKSRQLFNAFLKETFFEIKVLFLSKPCMAPIYLKIKSQLL